MAAFVKVRVAKLRSFFNLIFLLIMFCELFFFIKPVSNDVLPLHDDHLQVD